MPKKKSSKAKKDEQEDNFEIGQFQALPISMVENYQPDYSTEPTDAEEYLRRVHFQASKLEKTATSTKYVRTEFQDFEFDLEMYEKPKNEKFQINKEWKQDVLEQFKHIHEYFLKTKIKIDKKEMSQKVKGFKFNEKKWITFCKEIENDQRIPNIDILMKLEQIFFYQLFHIFINRIINEETDIETNVSIWIYNLFCFIEFPLLSDVSADLNLLKTINKSIYF
eukprot:gene12483-6231_t